MYCALTLLLFIVSSTPLGTVLQTLSQSTGTGTSSVKCGTARHAAFSSDNLALPNYPATALHPLRVITILEESQP